MKIALLYAMPKEIDSLIHGREPDELISGVSFYHLHDDLVAFHQVEDIHASLRKMSDWNAEPVAAGLDEFVRVKSGLCLAPSVTFGNRFEMIGKVF